MVDHNRNPRYYGNNKVNTSYKRRPKTFQERIDAQTRERHNPPRYYNTQNINTQKRGTSGIYKISNDRTGETYIGQSKNIEKRIKSHENELRQGTHHNRGIQWDYLKGDTFTYKVLEKTSPNKQILNQKEEKYISQYNSFNQGYNQTPGGQYDKYKGHFGHGGGRLSQKTNYSNNNYNSHKHNTLAPTMSENEFKELCLGILFFFFWPLISLHICMEIPYAAPMGQELTVFFLAIIFCIVVFVVGMIYFFKR